MPGLAVPVIFSTSTYLYDSTLTLHVCAYTCMANLLCSKHVYLHQIYACTCILVCTLYMYLHTLFLAQLLFGLFE